MGSVSMLFLSVIEYMILCQTRLNDAFVNVNQYCYCDCDLPTVRMDVLAERFKSHN